jgi:hypothetical protein
MNEYTTYPGTHVVETSGSGWSPLVAGGIGALVGWIAGRNTGPGWNNWNGGGCGGGYWGGNGGCQTCFQQGEYAGESRAADNFIAQKVNGLENMLVAMNNNMKDQRINDLVAKNQSLETRQLILETSMPLSCQLGQVNRTLDSVTTGCGFKSYPGCNNGCGF